MFWLLIIAALSLLLYWLLVTTEGVYLGRRVVVWLYDLVALRYDRIKGFNEDEERFFLGRPFLRALGSQRAPLILDVATGTGRLPLCLLQEPTFNGRVVALDPSRRMLNVAAAKLRPYRHRAALVQHPAAPLPFAANTFDAVTCIEAIEFFPSEAAALREMARVLRPGGALLVTRRRGREGQAFLGRYRTSAAFERLLRGSGLDNICTEPWQVSYDQVFARKPTADHRRPTARRVLSAE